MGKSTVAKMFADAGVPVFDADAAVHRLQGKGGRLVAAIEAAFPDTTGPEGVNRTALGEAVLGNPALLAKLEALVHPAVGEERAAFLAAHADAPLVVFDVPLLFETGGDAQSTRSRWSRAPADVQRARVLARPGMTETRLDAILARQTPDAEKRARADFVIDTGVPLAATRARVGEVIACLIGAARPIGCRPCAKSCSIPKPPASASRDGDRLVEIGCVELFNRVETGRTYHAYFHPERTMPAEAFAIHGLSDAFLSDKPLFADVVDELIEFLGDSPLVAHNASFDFGFLNGELGGCGRDRVCTTRMIDTLPLARTRHPGAKHSLDALCSRYGIDRSHRVAARRAARRAIAGAGLCRADRRAPDRAGPGRDARCGRTGRDRACRGRCVRPARILRLAREELARHAAFLCNASATRSGERAAPVDASEAQA